MAIDQTPEPEQRHDGFETFPPVGANQSPKMASVFVILAVLFVGEIYTLIRISALSGDIRIQQAKMQKVLSAQVQDQVASRLTALENSNAQQFETLTKELQAKSKGAGFSRGELRRTNVLLTELQSAQKQQVDQLKQEIAQKADQQQIGALTQDVSTTRTDLDNTKKALDATRTDLGMARSEFGTLIARNHDEIEQLRKMADRDYFEFVLNRKQPQRLAGVGLALTKTNPKRHQFNVTLTIDDMDIEQKNRSVNEPIFFYVGGSKRFYELVVNKVESRQVRGYLSAPKGAVQTASRSEGAL